MNEVIKHIFKYIFFAVILALIIQGSLAETFDGNTVYKDDSKAYLSATPHTLTSDGIITIQIQSKLYSGDVNVLFGFNTSNAVPKGLDLITYNEELTTNGTYSTIKQVTNIASMFNHIYYTFDNKNKWYYAQNLPVTAGTIYTLELDLDIIEGNGKYDIAIYPSSYGTNIQQAISDGNFYYLDPYWTTNANSEALESSLVSYWDFEDNSTTETDKHGTTDTTVNSATYTASGIIEGYYNFDGSSSEDISMTDPYTVGTQDLSVSLWFKTTYSSGQQVLLSSNSDFTDNFFKIYMESDGKIWVYTEGSSAQVEYGGGGAVISKTSTAYNDGEWHNLIFTRDGAVGHIIVDSNEDLTIITRSESIAQSGDVWQIGSAGTSLYFTGDIDEVAIFNTVISEKQILELYNNGLGLSHPFNYYSEGINHGLQASFTFDNGSLSDYTSNENDLTNDGATFTTTGCGTNGCFDFNAHTDDIKHPTGITAGNDAITLAFFVYIDAKTAGSAGILYYEQDDAGSTVRVAIQHGNADDYLDCYVRLDDGAGSSTNICDSANVVLNTTTLYHVTVVIDSISDTQQIYRNGILVSNESNSFSSGFDTGDSALAVIGTDSLTATKYLDGKIDEFLAWNRALNAQEVSDLYALYQDEGVKAQYPFNNSNNLIARLEASYEPINQETANYTFNGNPTGTTGIQNGAISLDGSGDYLSHSNSISSTDISMSAWFKTSQTWPATSGNDRVIVGNWNGGGTTKSLRIVGGYSGTGGGSANTLYCVIYTTTVQYVGIATTTGLNDGEWHNVQCIVDGTTLYTVVDGTIEDTDTIASQTYDDGADVLVGAGYTTGHYFNGELDDVRVYEKALNTTEQDNIYNSGIGNESYTTGDEVFHATMNSLTDQHNTNQLTTDDGDPIFTTDKGWNFNAANDVIHFDYTNSDSQGSICARFEMTSLNGAIATITDHSSATGGMIFDVNADELRLYHYTAASTNRVLGDTTLSINTEYHVCFVSDGSSYRLYLDGKEEGFTVSTGSDNGNWISDLDITPDHINLGAQKRSSGRDVALSGSIKEFKYYDRALSDADVLYLYNGTYNTYTFNTNIASAIVGNYTIIFDIVSIALNQIFGENDVELPNTVFNVEVNTTFSYNSTKGDMNCTYIRQEDWVAPYGYDNFETVTETFNKTGTTTWHQHYWHRASYSSYTYPDVEEQRWVYINCTDTDPTGADSYAINRTFYIDTLAPRFNISTYNNTNTTLDAIWINNTFKDLKFASTYTQLENKYNETNTTTASTTYTYYKDLDITQYGIGTWYVTGNVTDSVGNSIDYNTSFTINPDSNNLIIRAYNYLGTTPLTAVQITENHTSTIQYSNPFTYAITNYLNKNVWNLSVNSTINDTSYKHLPSITQHYITRHTTEFNVTLDPTKLTLTFDQDGAGYNTSGFILAYYQNDTTKPWRYDFDNSSIIIVQQELAQKEVMIGFGTNISGNYTQFYEYVNSEDHITETVEILNTVSSEQIHFQVMDQGRVPIKNAVIRMYFMENTSTWTEGYFAGQRLTANDGTDFFFMDESTEMFFRISADGYETQDLYYNPQTSTETYPIGSPKEIILPYSLTSSDGVWVLTDTQRDTCAGTVGIIQATNADRVQYTTTYGVSQGLGLIDITSSCNALMECPYAVPAAYCPADGQDWNLTIYIDNIESSVFVPYIDPEITYTEVLDITDQITDEGINENAKVFTVLALIALIVVILLAQLIFKGTVNDGSLPFTIGLGALILINTAFVLPFLIVLIGWVTQWYNRLLSE